MANSDAVWEQDGDLLRRSFASYEEYVEVQQSKLTKNLFNRKEFLPAYNTIYRSGLCEFLGITAIEYAIYPDNRRPGRSVLCLGARCGPEVEAWIDLGYFAVGIDLAPGPDNKYVVHGDFHDIQYPDNSVDIVFTNSVDHSIYPDKLASEAMRVLSPSGILIIHDRTSYGGEPDPYGATDWTAPRAIIDIFTRAGFKFTLMTKWSKAVLIEFSANGKGRANG